MVDSGTDDLIVTDNPAIGDNVPVRPAELVEQVEATIRGELDKVVPHLVTALKSNDAAKAMATRLDSAERKLAERNTRPVVSNLVGVLQKVRRLDFDPTAKEFVVSELEAVLIGAGYTEFGEAGDEFDPARHEAIDGEVGSGVAVIEKVFEPGLEALGDVVVPARVKVGVANQLHESQIEEEA